MTNFHSLRRIVDSLEINESTKHDPIKRTFVVDGQHLTANIGVLSDCGNALHTQPNHDELLVIIDGNVNFRVGGEVRIVRRMLQCARHLRTWRHTMVDRSYGKGYGAPQVDSHIS
jgi:hypothetical protein